jgi:hypothetical protein
MASRWVDSGIDWANLDLYKERQSWVIDELYRAMREKLSILRYSRNFTSSVEPWDLSYSLRDYNKVDEIVETILAWLSPTYSSLERDKGQNMFFDNVADVTTWTPSFTGQPWKGAEWFDSSVGGNFEGLVGDLSLLRDWSVGSSRIDADLLSLIYTVLTNLNEFFDFSKYVNRYEPPAPNDFEGDGFTFAVAQADFLADAGIARATTESFVQNRFVSNRYRLRQYTSHVKGSLNARNSNDVFVDVSNDDYKTVWFLDEVQGGIKFPELTYGQFFLTPQVGGEGVLSIAPYPFPYFRDSTTFYTASNSGRFYHVMPMTSTIVEYHN